MAALITVRDVTRRYGALRALDDVSLVVTEGEILCLLGPSGSGKSTLLRVIAGLEPPDEGAVLLRDRPITTLPPEQRGFGMMFQQFALFPHLTVAGNVAFGLEMQGMAPERRRARVDEMLTLVGLAGYGPRAIFDLSGGEQQRVALARSLAPAPPLLLLDEPLGALDRTLRERLVEEVAAILRRIGMTALYVTHDQQEAFAIADRLILLDRGRIIQRGTPQQLYRSPASPFVAEFFGLSNRVRVFHVKQLGEGQWEAATPIGTLRVETAGPATDILLIRPEAATLASPTAENTIQGMVVERSFRGAHYRVVTSHGDQRLEWELNAPERTVPAVAAPITLALRPDAMLFLAPNP